MILRLFRITISGFSAILVLCFIPFIFMICKLTPRKLRQSQHSKGERKVKIAYLRTDFWFGLKAGGSVTHISGFCKGVNKAGHKIFFISSGELENIDIELNHVFKIEPRIREKCIPLTVSILAYNVLFVNRALRIIKREEPDIICQRHSILNFSGVILSILYKVPFILEYNSSSFWKRETHQSVKMIYLLRMFEKINLMGADKIMVVSNVLKKELITRGFPASKIYVNPNGADCDMFKPNIDDSSIRSKYKLGGKIVVGFTGIYGPWHGVEFLAKSAQKVLKVNESIVFLFIGDDRLIQTVKAIGKETRVINKMIFVKDIPHKKMPKYLAACDILVSPHVNMVDGSRFFGSPVKIFEYMAMGKTIIASDIGQISEILNTEVSALLVQSGSEKEISAAILRLSKDNMLRKRLGEAARRTCLEGYSWTHNAKRVIDSYFDLISQKSEK